MSDQCHLELTIGTAAFDSNANNSESHVPTFDVGKHFFWSKKRGRRIFFFEKLMVKAVKSIL